MKANKYCVIQNKGIVKAKSCTRIKLYILFVLIFLVSSFSQKGISQPQFNTDTTDNISWQREFDEKDRLTKLIDPAGSETTYSYSSDSSGKTIVTKTNDEGNTVKLEFDERDLLKSMKDGHGLVEYQYDDFGRLIQVQREGDPAIQYKYDIEDRITSQVVGDFYLVSYTYDFLGRLSAINTPAGTISYEYQTGQGQVIRELPNGVKTIWEFKANGQQLKTTHIGQNDFLLAEFRYQYRPDGLIEAIAEENQSGENIKYFEYDKVGRLIHAFDQSGNDYKYEYDRLGNRLQATSQDGEKQVSKYDWAGRLISLNGNECSHDAAGNLNMISFGGSKMNYQYNQGCQLINVNNEVFYKYDGDGKLIERQVEGEITKFISNPLSDYWQPLVMENKSDGKTLLIWDRNTPLIIIRNGNPEYILTDHLGSARLFVDEQGKVERYIDYDPFGEPEYQDDGNELIMGFSGLFYDPNAKLYLTRARAYNPNSGQFMQIEPQQRIPYGSQKNLSLYAYCGNDPVNFIDLNGCWPYWVWGPENWAWQYLQLSKDDFNYFWKTPTRNDVIFQIMDNAVNKSQYRGDYKQAFHLAKTWRFNLESYKLDNPTAKIPTAAEFQIAENTMFARYFPVAAIGVPLWSYRHYKGERSGGTITPSSYGFQGETWERQTWKTVVYPIIGGIQGAVKYINEYICPHAHSAEITPSTVGGVYLGGAGQAFKGIGQIEGLSIDANNNLILISKKGDQIDLPPMRLDDIVTVFRSVYIYGEGPTVTIDPNPEDPENSAMIIKHGKATENTYVGWVLYQADRLMKSYMLGVDNISSQDLISNVPGYNDVLNSIYFGDGVSNTSKHEGKWERFWIVPAEVNQFIADSDNLTIFDVLLKLKTQVMKWENGVLVDDSLGKSSVGAKNFTDWFTREYDAIAKEQYLLPPSGSGRNEPVPVFAELRQIAVITALAEKMRDQGIAMPFWMRDYEVGQVQFEKYTPGMQVTRTKRNTKAHIFGGVSLSINSKEVKQFTSIADLNQLPDEERMNGAKSLKNANTLSTAILEYNSQTAPLQDKKFEIENESYQTVQIPGSATKALAPCRIEEVDMIIPIPGGKDIRLQRNFNSFFNPKDIWGQAWTMNLPRLEKVRIPIERSGNNKTYKTGYELLTPLNSMYVRFSDVKKVPLLYTQLQVPDTECNFFGLADSNPNFLTNPTIELIGKNGESWHFTEDGDLIAIEKDGFRKVYLRNQNGDVKQILGFLGKNLMASINLNYNSLNRIESATGKNELGDEQTVNYEYDSEGRLSEIISAKGKLGYDYEKCWISEVSWQDSTGLVVDQNSDKIVLRHFEYNNNGQLIAECDENEKRVDYAITTNDKKTTLKINQPEDSTRTLSYSYDSSFRPLETCYEDGAQVAWTYPENGGKSIEFIDVDGEKTHIVESADRTKRTIEVSKQPIVTEIYDQAGRLTQLNINDQNLIRQQWSPYGNLQSLETENCVLMPQYDDDGLTEIITLVPPGSGDQFEKWQTINLDFVGRPVKIEDYYGLQMAIQYDKKGEISEFITERDGKNYGYRFSRNDDGQVETVQSSWGNEQYTYDSTGALSKLIIKKTGPQNEEQALIEFDSGRLHRVVQFDGGQMEISYNDEGLLSDLPSQIKCPNGLKLNYSYNLSGNLDKIIIGDHRQVRLYQDDKGRIIGYRFEKN